MLFDPDKFFAPLNEFPKSIQAVEWDKITDQNSIDIMELLLPMYRYLDEENKIKQPKLLKPTTKWKGLDSFLNFVILRPANFPQPEIRLLEDRTTLIFMSTIEYHPAQGTKLFQKNISSRIAQYIDSLSPAYIIKTDKLPLDIWKRLFEEDFENYLIKEGLTFNRQILMKLKEFVNDRSIDWRKTDQYE